MSEGANPISYTAVNNDGFYTYLRDGINERKSEFDTELFMKLMTAQLTHQDPFEPMSNSELYDNISKMANVDSMDKMNDKLSVMNTNMDAMNAASLVGKSVVASSLDTGNPVTGKVTKVAVTDAGYVLTIDDTVSGLPTKANIGSVQEIS